MKIILLEDVKGLGKKNELVNASDGYAKNFLLKRNMAIEANSHNISIMKSRQLASSLKKKNEITDANEIKTTIDGKEITFYASAGENGKLFGSITSKDVADKLKEEYRVIIDKKKLVLKDHIKNIGEHDITIKIYAGISAKIKVKVVEEK